MKNNTKFSNLIENKNEIIAYIDSMTKTIEEKKTQIPLPKDITVFRREIYESKILDLYKKMPLNKQKDLQILIEKLHELDDDTIDSLLRDLISEDEIIIKKQKITLDENDEIIYLSEDTEDSSSDDFLYDDININ